jgi:hypothetical protein
MLQSFEDGVGLGSDLLKPLVEAVLPVLVLAKGVIILHA